MNEMYRSFVIATSLCLVLCATFVSASEEAEPKKVAPSDHRVMRLDSSTVDQVWDANAPALVVYFDSEDSDLVIDFMSASAVSDAAVRFLAVPCGAAGDDSLVSDLLEKTECNTAHLYWDNKWSNITGPYNAAAFTYISAQIGKMHKQRLERQEKFLTDPGVVHNMEEAEYVLKTWDVSVWGFFDESSVEFHAFRNASLEVPVPFVVVHDVDLRDELDVSDAPAIAVLFKDGTSKLLKESLDSMDDIIAWVKRARHPAVVEVTGDNVDVVLEAASDDEYVVIATIDMTIRESSLIFDMLHAVASKLPENCRLVYADRKDDTSGVLKRLGSPRDVFDFIVYNPSSGHHWHLPTSARLSMSNLLEFVKAVLEGKISRSVRSGTVAEQGGPVSTLVARTLESVLAEANIDAVVAFYSSSRKKEATVLLKAFHETAEAFNACANKAVVDDSVVFMEMDLAANELPIGGIDVSEDGGPVVVLFKPHESSPAEKDIVYYRGAVSAKQFIEFVSENGSERKENPCVGENVVEMLEQPNEDEKKASLRQSKRVLMKAFRGDL